jgi:siroheme synthase-like protein
MSSLFPIFVKLAGRTVLVVGAGEIAEQKVSQLLDTGCAIHVVAPEATKQIQLWAEELKIEWKRRPFEPTDLDSVFLIVVSTASRRLNSEICVMAMRRGVLCNVVDVPDLCDFYYPAIVKRGDLQIAISTSGQSPALAQRIKHELEMQFASDYDGFVKLLGRVRRFVLSRNFSPEWRKRLLHACAGRTSETFLKLRARGTWGAKA